MKKYLLVSLLLVLCLCACESTFERVFKQHLHSQLVDAQNVMDGAEEGTTEGSYRIGSKAALKEAIDKGYIIYYDMSASQETVDSYCDSITKAVNTFKMSVNPSLTNLRALIADATDLIAVATENGVSQKDIDNLSSLVATVQALLDDASHAFTQEEVLSLEDQLSVAVNMVEEQMPGPIKIRINNASFEPTSSTGDIITDFSNIPGWHNAGYVDGLTPWEGLLSNALLPKSHWMLAGKNVDGDYALYLQTYSKQVWQTLTEKVRQDYTYTVTIRVTRDQWKDADKTKFLLQLVSFDGEKGDFSKATVLAQQEFSNISSDDFLECKLVYSPLVNLDNVGKTITVSLRSYYNVAADKSDELVWQDTGVTVDHITITREKKE